MEKEIAILLIHIDAKGSCGEESITVCNRLTGEFIDDFDNVYDLNNLYFEDNKNSDEETYQLWLLDDFARAHNDVMIDLDKWFMAWVYIPANL